MEINPLQVLLFLLGFGSILFLAFVTTKYLAGKSNRAMKGKYIQVVETVSLGLDKRLILVRAGEQYVLLSATSKRMEFLTTIDLGQETENPADNPALKNTFDFRAIFDKYISTGKNIKENLLKQKDAGPGSVAKQDSSASPADDAGYGDFKANLGKLRTILQKGRQVGENDDETTDEE